MRPRKQTKGYKKKSPPPRHPSTAPYIETPHLPPLPNVAPNHLLIFPHTRLAAPTTSNTPPPQINSPSPHNRPPLPRHQRPTNPPPASPPSTIHNKPRIILSEKETKSLDVSLNLKLSVASTFSSLKAPGNFLPMHLPVSSTYYTLCFVDGRHQCSTCLFLSIVYFSLLGG